MQTNVLSQLKDIHTPEPIGWWPLAWGWYVVIALLLVVLILGCKQILARRKKHIVKKAALKAMQVIESEPLPMTTVRKTNDVLKRALLGYAPRADVANVTGEKWANILNELAPKHAQIAPNLLNLAYQPKCSAKDADEYFNQAYQWLKETLPIKPSDLTKAMNKELNDV